MTVTKSERVASGVGLRLGAVLCVVGVSTSRSSSSCEVVSFLVDGVDRVTGAGDDVHHLADSRADSGGRRIWRVSRVGKIGSVP